MKNAASSFLASYGVEFDDLKTGFVFCWESSFFFPQKDVNPFELLFRSRLRLDICLECVEALKVRNEFVKKVHLKERLVKQLLREKSKRYNQFGIFFFNLFNSYFVIILRIVNRYARWLVFWRKKRKERKKNIWLFS